MHPKARPNCQSRSSIYYQAVSYSQNRLQQIMRQVRHSATQAQAIRKMFDSRRGLYSCELEHGEELEKYAPGGFHPVAIGDAFQNGRYKIVHKLGYGGYSTVWLARDQELLRNVALRIGVAHLTTNHHRESAVLQALTSDKSNHPGRRHVVKELDTFQHKGPNGIHRVSIMELLGSSAAQAAENYFDDGRLPSSAACEVTRQMIQAVAYLHKLSICHGDIHPGNLVFVMPELQNMSEKGIEKVFGQPELYHVRPSALGAHEAGVPHYLVGSSTVTRIPNLSKPFEIRLIDFGSAFLSNDPPSNLITPMHVRAPEVALHVGLDHRLDLWSMGCTIFTLFAGGAAFDGFGTALLVHNMIELLGPLPQKWQNLYKPPSLPHLDADDIVDDYEITDFQQWLEAMMFDEEKTTDLSREQVQKLGCLLRKVIQYEPAERVSAAKLAEDPLWKVVAKKPAWSQQLRRHLSIR